MLNKMARGRAHPEVEFAVPDPHGGRDFYTHDFDEAVTAATTNAFGVGSSIIDVIIWDESGARWYGGDDAVEQYREDPDASVFERIEIKVNFMGRVP